TYVCSLVKDRQKYFLFQLFPAAPRDRAVPGAETKSQSDSAVVEAKKFESGDTDLRTGTFSFEANAAQKQKLECALQLARTVSLDFNNALTSILGHTSLVLSKMEASHPWRTSLVEVEKSAQRAAEIAQEIGRA